MPRERDEPDPVEDVPGVAVEEAGPTEDAEDAEDVAEPNEPA